MNPNRGGEQPAPQFEAGPLVGPEQPADVSEQATEQAKTPESSPSRQAAPIVSVQPILPVSAVPATSIAVPDDSSSASIPASDSDKIEKQWIEKAKAVIAQTKDDPFIQKTEMSRVKAAYIEKRFNKKIKTDEAVA